MALDALHCNSMPTVDKTIEISSGSQLLRQSCQKYSKTMSASKPKKSSSRKKIDVAYISTTFPTRFFNAFNEGDLAKLFRMVDEACTEDCELRTPFCPKTFSGRDNVKRLFQSFAMTHPDCVFKLKHTARLICEGDGSRAVAVTVYFVATRTGTQSTFTDELFRRPGQV